MTALLCSSWLTLCFHDPWTYNICSCDPWSDTFCCSGHEDRTTLCRLLGQPWTLAASIQPVCPAGHITGNNDNKNITVMIMIKKNAATHLAHHIISRTSRCFTIALATHTHTHTHTHSHTQTLTHTNTHTHTHTLQMTGVKMKRLWKDKKIRGLYYGHHTSSSVVSENSCPFMECHFCFGSAVKSILILKAWQSWTLPSFFPPHVALLDT